MKFEGNNKHPCTQKQRFTVPDPIKILIRQSLGNSPKITNQPFSKNCFRSLTSDISLYFTSMSAKARLKKSGRQIMRQYTKKAEFFLYVEAAVDRCSSTLQHRCFPVIIAKFLRTVFFIEHLQRLLLYMVSINWGWRGELFYFIVKPYKKVSGRLKHKLQPVVPVLCWYFF